MDVTSEQVHRLADTTYRNVGELMVDLKGLVAAAKTYHKTMQSMVSASQQFFTLMESIGAKAANLPGSVRKLGDSMREMVGAYGQINDHYGNVMNSLSTDFIVPLETKLDTDTKTITSMHRAYRLDCSRRQAMVEKTSGKVKSLQKKKDPTRAQMEKEAELKQVLSDISEELHSSRVEGLRRALLEERKLYIFVIDHYCSVIHNEISLNALSHQLLSTKVMEWTSYCSSPNELPSESAILLLDPRSPRAFSTSLSGEGLSQQQGFTDGTAAKARDSGTYGDEPRMRTRRTSCRVRALYPHQTSSGSQLEFNPGDLIDAINDPQEGWQFGENTKTGRSGWFPVQYVDQIWPTPEPVRRKKREDGGGGGYTGHSTLPIPTPSGRPLSMQSPPIPDRDYSTVPGYHSNRPGSAGHDHGMNRKSSQTAVSGYRK